MSTPMMPDPSMLQDLLARREAEKQRKGLPPGPMDPDQFSKTHFGELEDPIAGDLGAAAARKLNLEVGQRGQPQAPGGTPDSPETTAGGMEADQAMERYKAPANEVRPQDAKTMIRYGMVQMWLDKAKAQAAGGA